MFVEYSEQDIINRSHKAYEILNDEFVMGMLDMIEEGYTQKWKLSADLAGREAAWNMVTAVTALRAAFAQTEQGAALVEFARAQREARDSHPG